MDPRDILSVYPDLFPDPVRGDFAPRNVHTPGKPLQKLVAEGQTRLVSQRSDGSQSSAHRDAAAKELAQLPVEVLVCRARFYLAHWLWARRQVLQRLLRRRRQAQLSPGGSPLPWTLGSVLFSLLLCSFSPSPLRVSPSPAPSPTA